MHAGVVLDTGETVTAELVRGLVGGTELPGAHADTARTLFEQVALADEFVDFLTLPAYALID